MREIRTLRAMWRALETELRQLLNGHEEGNLGYKPRRNLRATAPALDPTNYELPSVDAIRAAIAAGHLKGVEVHRLVDLASKSAGAS